MSTVGYGDLYAVTSEARIVLFFGGLLFGTLIVAVMTASFVDWAALAPSDVRITNEVQRRIWERKVSFLLCTVTFYANLAHSWTRSP